MWLDPQALIAASQHQHRQQGWVSHVCAACAVLGLRPGRPVRWLLLTAAIACGLGWQCYAATRALLAGGVVRSVGCAWRAVFWMILHSLTLLADWVGSYAVLHAVPSVWTLPDAKQAHTVLRNAFIRQPARLLLAAATSVIPLAFWFGARGTGWWLAALAAHLAVAIAHRAASSLSRVFAPMYLERKQAEYRALLLAGEYSYDEAVRAYRRVNDGRRALAGAVRWTASVYAGGALASACLLLYDCVLKPWGAWPLFVWYVHTGLFLCLHLAPWVELNGWPAALACDVAETVPAETDRGLGWDALERADFIAFLGATGAKASALGVEIGPSAYAAVVGLLLGWVAYVWQLRQFSEIERLPLLDALCGYD